MTIFRRKDEFILSKVDAKLAGIESEDESES